MNASMHFKLPEERREYLAAVHGMDFALALKAVDQNMRAFMKYEHNYKTPDEVMQAVLDIIRDELDKRNVSLEMIE